jgi:hypothetical protein
MTRKILTSALAALALMGGATQAMAEWRGIFLVTSATPQCEEDQTAEVGTTGKMRFRVPNVLGNNNTTRFTFVYEWGAQSYARVGAVGSVFVPMNGGGVGSGPYSFSNATARIVSLSPAAPTASTQFVNIVMQINNLEGAIGCNVTLRSALNRRN